MVDQYTISIDDLPETSEILSSDRFYIITRRGQDFIKEEISIDDLSAYFYAKDVVDKFDAKYAELVKLSNDFMNFLKTTYPTASYVSSNFSTTSSFNNVYKYLENVDTVSAYLDEYADSDYEQFMKLDAKKQCEELKLEYQQDSGDDIMSELERD